VAGAIGLGLGVGLGVGLAVELAVGLGVGLMVGNDDAVAGGAPLATTFGLGVAALEQATTASITKKIEPIRASRPVRTLSPPGSSVSVAS
jgi:hypothetical protein